MEKESETVEQETKKRKIKFPSSFKDDVTKGYVEFVEESLSNISCADLKWIGFYNSVCPCLVSKDTGSIMIARPMNARGICVGWAFTLLAKDAPGSTLIMYLERSMLKTQVKATLGIAVKPTKFFNALMINHLRESGYMSTEFGNKYRENLLSIEVFVRDNYFDAYECVDKWLDTKEADFVSVSIKVKKVPDDPSGIFQNEGGGDSVGSPTNSDQPICIDCEEGGEDDQDLICSCCVTNKVGTVVHPCKCAVLCVPCSIRIRSTADKNRCFRCRRKITQVENIETGEMTKIT